MDKQLAELIFEDFNYFPLVKELRSSPICIKSWSSEPLLVGFDDIGGRTASNQVKARRDAEYGSANAVVVGERWKHRIEDHSSVVSVQYCIISREQHEKVIEMQHIAETKQ